MILMTYLNLIKTLYLPKNKIIIHINIKVNEEVKWL